MSKLMFQSAMLVAVFLVGAPLAAQEEETRPTQADSGGDEYWYYRQPTNYQPDVRAIIHQKAQANAQQRQMRLASMSWYGMSNSRPTASPTPFMTQYSPAWQMPGNRPYAWFSYRAGFPYWAR